MAAVGGLSDTTNIPSDPFEDSIFAHFCDKNIIFYGEAAVSGGLRGLWNMSIETLLLF